MPMVYAPPWIQTMTGSLAAGPGSGDQTLIVNQSSPTVFRADRSMPNAAACGGGGGSGKTEHRLRTPRSVPVGGGEPPEPDGVERMADTDVHAGAHGRDDIRAGRSRRASGSRQPGPSGELSRLSP